MSKNKAHQLQTNTMVRGRQFGLSITFQNICHETDTLNPKSKHSVKAPKLMFLCFTGKERRTSVIAFMSALWSVFTGPEQAVATQQHATKIWSPKILKLVHVYEIPEK